MSDQPQTTPRQPARHLSVPKRLANACYRRAAELEMTLDELNRQALFVFLELSLRDEAGWSINMDHDEQPDHRLVLKTSASAVDRSLAQAYIEETEKLSPTEEKEAAGEG